MSTEELRAIRDRILNWQPSPPVKMTISRDVAERLVFEGHERETIESQFNVLD